MLQKEINMFKYYNHLGFQTKYYTEIDNKLVISDDFKHGLKLIENRKIDTISIIEFINRFYFFGDRTIIKGLYNTPWLSYLKEEQWITDIVLDKKTNINSEKEFMETFLTLVENEIIDYIGNSKEIGILLSGGMDSRIVAAIINKLNIENKIQVNITALTWGIDSSRDVIYAKRICDLYNWNFKHFDLTPNVLETNIQIAAQNGCSYSPVHLHAMNAISKVKDVDLILAGSFGDSIGRAEYSGKHASNITSIGKGLVNKFSLVKHGLYIDNINKTQSDLEQYYIKHPRKNKYSLYELELQIHYMRKELNSCMAIINNKIPLHQVFTSPEVYNFVLNTDLKFRNDRLYYLLLDKVDKRLLNIPWARTGKPYLQDSCKADNYSKEYHSYGKWIKHELSKMIENKIYNGNIEKLNIFNMSTIDNMIKYNKKYGTAKLNRVDELLIWLASLSDMVNLYDIEGVNSKVQNNITKFTTNLVSKVQLIAYFNAIRILK
jgi:asparagine synthase (glutamine-hydrolysing)